MLPLLNDKITTQVKAVFEKLQSPVMILFFGDDEPEMNEASAPARQLLEEVAALSPLLSFEAHDLHAEADFAAQFNINAAPSFTLVSVDEDNFTDYGIRYKGTPAGHEFTSLISDLMLVSSRDSGLSPETREFLHQLTAPLHLQVFVTPTCPYCPRAVVLAHQMALESEWVEAEMVEAEEFPALANQFSVSGVPQITINHGAGTVIGAVPEGQLVNEIRAALRK